MGLDLSKTSTDRLKELLSDLNGLTSPSFSSKSLGWELDYEVTRRESLVLSDDVWNRLQTHGELNYNKGWDTFVECWGRTDVQNLVVELGSDSFDVLRDEINETMELIKEVGDDIRGS